VPDPAKAAAFAPVTNPALTLGLAGVHDWSVQQPFLDLMKTARPWIGHLPGQWGGWDHARLNGAGALGANGWPTLIPPDLTGISTLILTDLPAGAGGVAGGYVLTYDGGGPLRVEGRVSAVDAKSGRITFDFTPGDGGVLLTITATDPADPIRNISVVRKDRADLLATGAIFNPDWLARIRGVQGVRFMDWMATNNATLIRADDRPRPADYTWARVGVPAEVMVALANELDADPWFTLPHQAEDALVRTYARIVHDGLKPGLVASVEYSNEVWNWQFQQAAWADAQGRARWNRDDTWVQFYALRAAEVVSIWADVFGTDAPDRLIRVIATQTGWLGLEELILAPPLADADRNSRPVSEQFDAYAVAFYLGGHLGQEARAPQVRGWLATSQAGAEAAAADLGLTGTAATDHVAAHRFDAASALAIADLRGGTSEDADTLTRFAATVLPYHRAVAARYGLDLVMYEGGTHVVGIGPSVEDAALTDFFTHLNYTPEMARLYTDMMAAWAAVTDAPFNAFVDVFAPGRYGSWGALRHLTDDNPRWQALASGCAAC